MQVVNSKIENKRNTKLESSLLAAKVIDALHGKGGTHTLLNGRTIQISENGKRLYIDDLFIPVDQLISNLTEHERAELEGLPKCDGNNSYIITSTCLSNVATAIYRFIGPDKESYVPLEDQLDNLARCECRQCRAKRQKELETLGWMGMMEP